MMSYDDLNSFIENYLKNDKSQRALMLTAPWGTGKSYYIKNSLCPFLHNNKLNYAVVSLYGMTSIKDISKNIYLEIRTKSIFEKSEKANAGLILGKTIIKGVASFFNVDLNQNENDLERLYKSIDLSNQLIILEDLERTNLDVVEVLGFVNNLVEQDGVKVLIVANENEIIKVRKNNVNGKEIQEYTPESIKYLKIKEKTVGDTLHFSSNTIESITSIVRSFDNPSFNKLLEEKDPNGDISFSRRVCQQLPFLKCCNFRSILYACQKMDEILKKSNGGFDLKFIQNLFIGTIAYSIRVNNNGSRIWDSQSLTSQNLGTFAYPLLKPMYDYIENHTYNINSFKEVESLYLKAQEINVADEKLKVLYNYYVYSEKELSDTIDFIEKNLNEDKRLIHDEYARIANYLISVKYEVGFENKTNECISLMLKNAKHSIDNGQKVSTYIRSGIQLNNKEQALELNNFINEIEEYQKKLDKFIQRFTYNAGDLSDYYEYLIKNNITFTDKNGFINKFDSSKLVSMLEKASPNEIEQFRGIIQHVYLSYSNINDFFSCDLLPLKEFVNKLENIDSDNEGIDKIQELQLKWLMGDLNEILNKLEN